MKKEFVKSVIEAAKSIQQSSVDSEIQYCDIDAKSLLLSLEDTGNKHNCAAFQALSNMIEQLIDDVAYYETEMHDKNKEIQELNESLDKSDNFSEDKHFKVDILKLYTSDEYDAIFQGE